jgi:phenylacetate-coenzyme A ligase PaaK-like adenylate-forming protein
VTSQFHDRGATISTPGDTYPRDPEGWARRRELNFARMLDLVCCAHPYYRRVFAARGIQRELFRSLSDIELIPPIDKTVFAAEPEAFTLDAAAVPDATLEERTVWQLIYTTGTTGRPTPFVDRAHDHYSRIWQMRLAGEIAGITERDLVLNLMPLTSVPHQGFLSATYAPLALGAPLLAGVGGRPYADFPVQRELDEIIRLGERHRVTVLWGIATFTRRFIVRAGELGADLGSVRLVLAMGEACPAGMRDDMRVRLAELGARDVRVLNGYGFTEMQGPTMECDEGSGFHVPNPAEYHFEILDSKNLQSLPEGAAGIVTMSHLNRRGTVLLRYMTGDVSALTSDPCTRCGRAGPRFTVTPYRLSGLTKIKGVLVNPASLHEALAAVRRLDAYQIVVSKERGDPYGLDELTVRILCNSDDVAAVSADIVRGIRSACEVTPHVEPIPAEVGAQWAQGYKHAKFVDTREQPRP